MEKLRSKNFVMSKISFIDPTLLEQDKSAEYKPLILCEECKKNTRHDFYCENRVGLGYAQYYMCLQCGNVRQYGYEKIFTALREVN